MNDLMYFAPQTIDEARNLIGMYKSRIVYVSGGLHVALELKNRNNSDVVLIDLNAIPLFDQIWEDEHYYYLGTCVKHDEVTKYPTIKSNQRALYQAASHIGDQQIRNWASIGGTIAFADSYGDYWSVFYAMEGYVHLCSLTGTRIVPLTSWLQGRYHSVLHNQEFISFLQLTKVCRSAFRKKEILYQGSLCVAGVYRNQALRIAFTGLEEIPIVINIPISEQKSVDEYILEMIGHLEKRKLNQDYLVHMSIYLGEEVLRELLYKK